MIKRRLCSIAIISSVRFSAANRDSPCDEVVVFGPCLDSRRDELPGIATQTGPRNTTQRCRERGAAGRIIREVELTREISSSHRKLPGSEN